MKANESQFRRPGGMSMEESERLHNAYAGVWQDTFTVRGRCALLLMAKEKTVTCKVPTITSCSSLSEKQCTSRSAGPIRFRNCWNRWSRSLWMHQRSYCIRKGAFRATRRGKGADASAKAQRPRAHPGAKQQASLRGKVEHSIGRVKVFRMLQDRLRMYKQGIKDLVMEFRCTLHNFKVAYKT